MSPTHRLILGVSVLAVITAVGTLGYRAVADLSWVDAVYMTVITITTVGYAEVAPLSRTARLFTIGLIVTSVGTTFYFATALAELVVEGRLRELFQRTSMKQRIEQLSDHVILCGFGRFGRIVAEELREARVNLVVVERDPQREPELGATGLPYLIASATADDALDGAGIERARAIIVATGSDSDNVFITLSAREKSKRVRIHVRAESEGGARRLKLAGADQVTSPYQLGGQQMAAAIVRPSVVDFLEISRPSRGPEVALEEIRVAPDCPLVGSPISAAERVAPRVRVVALKRSEESIQLVPDENAQIGAGDHLVVIGERTGLERLAQIAGGRALAPETRG